MKCNKCHTPLPEFGRFEKKVCPNCSTPVLFSKPVQYTPSSTVPRTKAQAVWFMLACSVSFMVFITMMLLQGKLGFETAMVGIVAMLLMMVFAILALVFSIKDILRRIANPAALRVKPSLLLTMIFCFAASFCYILLIGSMVSNIYYDQNCDSFVETQAVVSRIETSIDEDGDEDHQIYIQYSFDGETYEEKYRPYDDTIDQGDSIKILVDPADPEDLPRKEPGLTTVSAVFFAGFCLLLGLLTVKPLLEQKRFEANYQQ